VRYLILSDIHGNRAALDAVLAAAKGKYDAILNCGDVVGYGPDPNYTVSFSREQCLHTIRGNHDKASVGLVDLEWFNPVARTSAIWTGEVLTLNNAAWIAALPQGPFDFEGFSLIHGSPPDEDEYMVDVNDAEAMCGYAKASLYFFGHTHLQGGFQVHRSGSRAIRPTIAVLDDTSLWFINPGSVGQPRDNDPRAGWAVYESESRTVTYHRTEYDIDDTYRRIVDAGLPEVLGLRLYRGI
jgi:predicted phosphodiesterase